MAQRFVTGLDVFDTYYGKKGSIVQMDLASDAVPALAPLFEGAYFVVQYVDQVRQTFTVDGRRVNHADGSVLPGVTLVTNPEYVALTGAGYPTV